MSYYLHTQTPQTAKKAALYNLSNPIIAQAQSDSFYYGEGVYNSEGLYSGTPNTPATSLIDTGSAAILFITVGSILVFGAIIARVWKRRPNQAKQTNDVQ